MNTTIFITKLLQAALLAGGVLKSVLFKNVEIHKNCPVEMEEIYGRDSFCEFLGDVIFPSTYFLLKNGLRWSKYVFGPPKFNGF